MDSNLWLAFVVGLISACSLPLGTLTAAVWKPGDRAIAVLMAFGGGALLAALTIDLVGAALERGHFYQLALGAVSGGLLFIGLNQLVNAHGGFLRKRSTTFNFLRAKGQGRFAELLGHLQRTEVFKGLPGEEVALLASHFQQLERPKGAYIYRKGDPSQYLYIVDKGEVELLDPFEAMKPFDHVGEYAVFGRNAFFSNRGYATVARAKTDCRFWVLSRRDFFKVVLKAPKLYEQVRRLLEGPQIAAYLTKRHRLSPQEAEDWIDREVFRMQDEAFDRDEDEVEEEFRAIMDQIGRVPIFAALPDQEAQLIAARVFPKEHDKGHIFFHQADESERMYVIDQGQVALIGADQRADPDPRSDRDAFGVLAFLTGAPHAFTAVALSETSVWVLKKRDFEALLVQCPAFAARVRAFIGQPEVAGYLESAQRLASSQALKWSRKAARSMEAGSLIPSAQEMVKQLKSHGSAPIAIWLGIFLDGIPESLVLGSNLIHSATLNLSLIAGLFLSNYPEALSSSVGMRAQGMSFRRVLTMWSSLMLFTGLGAALGNLFLQRASPELFSLIEGIAAGSMLTMIAETMLPEAYMKGGSVVGITTLLGFLAAIFFTTLH